MFIRQNLTYLLLRVIRVQQIHLAIQYQFLATNTLTGESFQISAQNSFTTGLPSANHTPKGYSANIEETRLQIHVSSGTLTYVPNIRVDEDITRLGAAPTAIGRHIAL